MVPVSAALAALLCVAPGGEPVKATRPPNPAGNILILLADDLGVEELAAYGVGPAPAPTPTLDQIAASGVLFRNVWSQPTCSPTRATIQTGRYGFRTHIGSVINAFASAPALPLSEVTLPEMLDLGTGGRYAHAAIGKWHLGSAQVGGDLAPNLAGYSHFAGSMEGQLQHYQFWRRVVNGSVSTSTRYATTACVNDALSWIRRQVGPWLCVVNFQAPHAPFHRPPAGLHTQALPGTEPSAICSDPGTSPQPFYKAMVQALDTEIGRLLERLPPGELARTTVIFLGDNGTDPCVARAPYAPNNKGTLFEGGVRVPLLVAGYGVTGRGPSDALVNTSDLFATVAELAGVDLAATLPGVTLDSISFVPSLADPAQGSRQWIYADSFSMNGAGNPPPVLACPVGGVCQPSIGFDGPGDAVLTSCGSPLYGLYGANLVPWRLTGAPPGAPIWLVIGPYAPAWNATLGAEVVSPVPAYLGSFSADPAGEFQGAIWTPSASAERHYQVVVLDHSEPTGYSVSNALRMDLLPTHMRAARGARYKLLRSDPCHEALYDLASDPFEHTDLLAGPLPAEALAAHAELAAVLDSLQ